MCNMQHASAQYQVEFRCQGRAGGFSEGSAERQQQIELRVSAAGFLQV